MTNAAQLFGHETQQKALARLLSAKKMPSTILFSGPAGVGKRLLAIKLARSLLCENLAFGGCSECKYCALVDSNNHPDFFRIECGDKEAWDLDRLRELLYSLNLKAFCGGNRVVLFNDADCLNIQSSNLLLKSLEEPRPDTYFILVASHRAALPATLVSRCQTWFFDRLSSEQMSKIFKSSSASSNFSASELQDILALADGSCVSLSSLIDKQSEWKSIGASLQSAANGNLNAALDLAQSLAKDKERIPEMLGFMRIFARQEMKRPVTPEIKALWAAFIANVLTAERLISERNLAAATVLSALLLSLHREPGKPAFTALTNSANLLQNSVV